MRRPPRLPRPSMVMLPNGFTLMNLFFGIWSIVAASQGRERAGGVVYHRRRHLRRDRRPRCARDDTGSRFGEELDSLVDAISFGTAPAMLIYFAVLQYAGVDWTSAQVPLLRGDPPRATLHCAGRTAEDALQGPAQSRRRRRR